MHTRRLIFGIGLQSSSSPTSSSSSSSSTSLSLSSVSSSSSSASPSSSSDSYAEDESESSGPSHGSRSACALSLPPSRDSDSSEPEFADSSKENKGPTRKYIASQDPGKTGGGLKISSDSSATLEGHNSSISDPKNEKPEIKRLPNPQDMPHFPPDIRPIGPGKTEDSQVAVDDHRSLHKTNSGDDYASRIRIKNRRKMYLDRNPDYFSPSLELADPLLYDRCIRRFQSTAEREAEGRRKGYSGVLEADLMRSEAKLAALANPTSATVAYNRGPNGEIYPEDPEDVPENKGEGIERWQREMTLRFLRGEDNDFDYSCVDQSEEWDDRVQEDREEQEKWFAEEEPNWLLNDDEGAGNTKAVEGETGVQDF